MKKDNRQWFPHDDDARNDPKLLYIIRTHGMEGYGCWWILVEILRAQAGYRIERKKYNLASIASQMHMEDKEFEKFLQALHDCELIRLTETHISCPTLEKKMSYWDERTQHMRDMNEKRWSGKVQKTDNLVAERAIPGDQAQNVSVEPMDMDGTPPGYPEFEFGVISSWNAMATKHPKIYPVNKVTGVIRSRLLERFKERKFVLNYDRIIRHIDDNPYFHGKNQTGFHMSLARLIEGERHYSNILEQIGAVSEEKSFRGEGVMVGQTIKDVFPGSGIQVSSDEEI